MGQPIKVESTLLDDVVIFTTDRSLSGQDGVALLTSEEAQEGATWPARLASRLWDRYPDITGVFILSNTISVRRPQWTEPDIEGAAAVIRDLFVFYEENRAAAS